ncbi:hypothetical protein [Streptomyces sp. SAS_270]|uniref:hypothetical protein n=1 Tax=Streptomyces sp. SAS_270 TaxID=3412748 RepID=UPI00403CE361
MADLGETPDGGQVASHVPLAAAVRPHPMEPARAGHAVHARGGHREHAVAANSPP